MKESLDMMIGKIVFKFLKQFNKMSESNRKKIIDLGEKSFVGEWLSLYNCGD